MQQKFCLLEISRISFPKYFQSGGWLNSWVQNPQIRRADCIPPHWHHSTARRLLRSACQPYCGYPWWGTRPEEVGRVPLEVLEGREPRPHWLWWIRGDTGLSDRGPDTGEEGSLGSSGTCRTHLGDKQWKLFVFNLRKSSEKNCNHETIYKLP